MLGGLGGGDGRKTTAEFRISLAMNMQMREEVEDGGRVLSYTNAARASNAPPPMSPFTTLFFFMLRRICSCCLSILSWFMLHALYAPWSHALMLHALMLYALMLHALMFHALMFHALMLHALMFHAPCFMLLWSHAPCLHGPSSHAPCSHAPYPHAPCSHAPYFSTYPLTTQCSLSTPHRLHQKVMLHPYPSYSNAPHNPNIFSSPNIMFHIASLLLPTPLSYIPHSMWLHYWHISTW